MDGSKLRMVKAKGYSQDYLLVAGLIYHWRKLKPDNDELKAMALAIADIGAYVKGLEDDIRAYSRLVEETENNKND